MDSMTLSALQDWFVNLISGSADAYAASECMGYVHIIMF